MSITTVSVTMMSVSGSFRAIADLVAGQVRTRSGGGAWEERSLEAAERSRLQATGAALVALGSREERQQFADGEVHIVVSHRGGDVTWSFVTETHPQFGEAEPLWRWACEAVR